jgi:hypothetical protein
MSGRKVAIYSNSKEKLIYNYCSPDPSQPFWENKRFNFEFLQMREIIGYTFPFCVDLIKMPS